MSRKKKRNSTNPSGKQSHIPGDFFLPIRSYDSASILNISLENGILAYPNIFPSFGELARDTSLSDESFWKAIKGLLSCPINLHVLVELKVKSEVIHAFLKRSKETILIIDDLPVEVLATARVFIADGMNFNQALDASRKI